MVSTRVRTEIAQSLATAERNRAPIPPLSQTYPSLNVVDAYEIALLGIRERVASGARVVGHKVGLSSRAMQTMMGVDEPDYGHLLDTMELTESEPVDIARFCMPRVEVEIAFVLGADLPGSDCTDEDVRAATATVAASIELIDSRIIDWRIGICDTVADNASSAGFVLGAQRSTLAEVEPAAVDAALFIDDVRIAEGRGDAVLGDPVRAVSWLARTVAGYGVRLKSGDIVLPGSCTRAIDVAPGQHIRADFGTLGSVSLEFTKADVR
ncbi:MAG: 2-keto-4-pentenoate hydratase [Rhodococcus sp. (in: high G+C Gram-positive bacteria)]